MGKNISRLFYFFLVILIICLIGLVYAFTDSYYLRSLRTVSNVNDPRWRVFDFNSRQATEGDIYNVAEIPVISKVKEISPRKLRFWFSPPIKTTSWKIIDFNTGKVMGRGSQPEIQFPDHAYKGTIRFIPEGVLLFKELRIDMEFYSGENYNKKGLSWGDNFYTPASDIPFSLNKPHSIDEWVGFDRDDPELAEAKRILGNTVDTTSTSLRQSEQVYKFVMNKIEGAGGTPSDEVQSSSPLETYKLFISGKGKGWCENKALIYYLFANAAGIKTRLVDLAGKFGPLKLAGHYFCESWIPEYGKWVYVDPQLRIANIRNHKGIPMHTIELKKLVDLNVLEGTSATVYRDDRLVPVNGSELYSKIAGNIPPYTVIAYKFGYANNKNFSKISNFLKHTTLLYAPFTLPKLYLIKYIFLYGFIVSLMLTFLAGFLIIIKKMYFKKINHE